MSEHETPAEVGKRLRRTRRNARIAAHVITAGGVSVLAAVIAIFLFIGWEALPLLGDAVIRNSDAPALSTDAPIALVVDEYREVVVSVERSGEISFLNALTGEKRRSREFIEGETVALRSACVTRSFPLILGGTIDGRVGVAAFVPQVEFDADGVRSVDAGLERFDTIDVFAEGAAVTRVAGVVEDEETVVAVAGDSTRLSVLRFRLGMGRARVTALPGLDGDARVTAVEVASFGDQFRIYAGLADGRVMRWDVGWTSEARLFESFAVSTHPVTDLQVLLGEETLIVGDADGALSAWFGVRRTPEARNWNMTRIRDFAALKSAVVAMSSSARSKSFLAFDENGRGTLYHNTTSRVLGRVPGLVGDVAVALIAPKSDGFYVADTSGGIHAFDLDSPHPEASVSALFTPVWYEGATEPALKWQSTGGSNDFEPKLSISTLVFGSLKGVFYALLFSIPLAIASAIYTALFLPSKMRARIKPAIEIMAAVPSVVVGLLAALWLSPIVERHLAEFFSIAPASVLAFAATIALWRMLPSAARRRLSSGPNMLFVSLPGLATTVVLALVLAAPLESVLFGGDLKSWLRNSLDLPYDPRNSLVVGFAMAFAVVPVIFTIAEDAISNVPKSLWAASEALGASRWQTTWRIVLPAAAPGVFAALMLGFGRAIGETMIVLMATGNTPIIDMSPFNGMRTISACIAVEIPEAPHGGTLYRILFLSSALLFAFTFCCNTLAEVVGHRLRQKYGRF